MKKRGPNRITVVEPDNTLLEMKENTPTKASLFAIVKTGETDDPGTGVPTIDLEVQQYVNLSFLSSELQDKIREELKINRNLKIEFS